MSAASLFTQAHIDALVSLRDALAACRWVLIGANAIRTHVTLPRNTFDLDLVVCVEGTAARAVLSAAGWQSTSGNPIKWRRNGVVIDVIPLTDAELEEPAVSLQDGFSLSVIGFDLAFAHSKPVLVDATTSVDVPPIAILALLKMVAWTERKDRTKDLEDLMYILDHALPDDHDVRFDPGHAVFESGLPHEVQSAFFVGLEIARLGSDRDRYWAKQFLEEVGDEDSANFTALVRAARYGGDNPEERVVTRLNAIAKGLDTKPDLFVQQAVAISKNLFGQSTNAVWPPTARTSRTVRQMIHRAIVERRELRFKYQGRERIVEPHVLGTSAGKLGILAYQVGGASSKGKLPDWRRFEIAKMSNVEVLDQQFAGARPAYGRESPFDHRIAIVR